MSPGLQVGIYSLAILAGALLGAWVPLVVQAERRMTLLLATSAGIMLGAAFFHMLPEAFHGGGYIIFTVVPLGFVLLFLLERYVLVHVHEGPDDYHEHEHP